MGGARQYHTPSRLKLDLAVLCGAALVFFSIFAYLGWPALAQGVPGPGESVPVPDGPASAWANLYLLCLGAATPLVGYVLNHYAPWASEQVKGVVQGALAAGVAVLYQAVTPGDLGLNDQTLLACVTAVVGSIVGHLGWTFGRVNVALGGGRNSDGSPSQDKLLVK